MEGGARDEQAVVAVDLPDLHPRFNSVCGKLHTPCARIAHVRWHCTSCAPASPGDGDEIKACNRADHAAHLMD